jgi:hypothetical protein
MAGETLVYFGHHKCATQYIKAVVREAAAWLGLTFATVDRSMEPATAESDGALHHHSHPITEHNSERMSAWRKQLAAAPSLEEGLLLERAWAGYA